jgi:hypothetical protein
MLGVLGLTVPDHGDRRLNERQMTVMERLAERPRDAIPHAMATEAEAEAYYRFIRNPRVEAADILQPHFQAVGWNITWGWVEYYLGSDSGIRQIARSKSLLRSLSGGNITWD